MKFILLFPHTSIKFRWIILFSQEKKICSFPYFGLYTGLNPGTLRFNELHSGPFSAFWGQGLAQWWGWSWTSCPPAPACLPNSWDYGCAPPSQAKLPFFINYPVSGIVIAAQTKITPWHLKDDVRPLQILTFIIRTANMACGPRLFTQCLKDQDTSAKVGSKTRRRLTHRNAKAPEKVIKCSLQLVPVLNPPEAHFKSTVLSVLPGQVQMLRGVRKPVPTQWKCTLCTPSFNRLSPSFT